jgi:hypothetical protein
LTYFAIRISDLHFGSGTFGIGRYPGDLCPSLAALKEDRNYPYQAGYLVSHRYLVSHLLSSMDLQRADLQRERKFRDRTASQLPAIPSFV